MNSLGSLIKRIKRIQWTILSQLLKTIKDKYDAVVG